jgi:hypothetical protein
MLTSWRPPRSVTGTASLPFHLLDQHLGIMPFQNTDERRAKGKLRGGGNSEKHDISELDKVNSLELPLLSCTATSEEGHDFSERSRQRIRRDSPWPESASELHRPSDRCLSAKLVSSFADRGCHVVSATDPYGSNLGSLDRSRYFFFQVAPQLYSRGWVDSVPDTSSQKIW